MEAQQAAGNAVRRCGCSTGSQLPHHETGKALEPPAETWLEFQGPGLAWPALSITAIWSEPADEGRSLSLQLFQYIKF